MGFGPSTGLVLPSDGITQCNAMQVGCVWQLDMQSRKLLNLIDIEMCAVYNAQLYVCIWGRVL